MALTERQYYQIYKTPSFTESTTRSAEEITVYNVASSSLTGDKILLAAPGVGKQIILLSLAATNSGFSLGKGASGGGTLITYVPDGGVTFPSGLPVGENEQVSCNSGGGNYISITYIIVDV